MPAPQRSPCDEPFRSNEMARLARREDAEAREALRIERSATRYFGPWWLDRSTLSLNLLNEEGGHEYHFDLERCSSDAATLNGLAEVGREAWVTPEQLGWLTFAICELFAPGQPGEDAQPIEVSARLRDLGWI